MLQELEVGLKKKKIIEAIVPLLVHLYNSLRVKRIHFHREFSDLITELPIFYKIPEEAGKLLRFHVLKKEYSQLNCKKYTKIHKTNKPQEKIWLNKNNQHLHHFITKEL